MLEQKLLVGVSPSPVVTVEDYAVAKFAESGRTVMVTRNGDAPIVPFTESIGKRRIKYLVTVADQKEIERLKNIKEMRKRFQILESVPYTDIIVAHELPREKVEIEVIDTAAKVSLPLTIPMELLKMVSGPFGMVWEIAQAVTVGAFSLVVAGVGLVMGMAVNVAMTDPIVWARLEDGSWLELARWEE